MFDENGHNPTVYLNESEMRYFESGEYERDLENREEAREIARCARREGILDDMGIDRGSECRECPWLIEAFVEPNEYDADSVWDDDERVEMCKLCNAHSKEDRDEVLTAFFEEKGW